MKNRHKSIAFAVALTFLAPLAVLMTGCKGPTAEEIQAMIQLVDVQTKWVMKEYRQWPNPKLVIVPVVTFKVKNISSKPVAYMNFNAIFKEKEGQENVGDNFLAAIRKNPIPPGGTSAEITLKSNFGVEGRNVEDIQTNPYWKPFIVKVFAVKASHHVPMGQWDVSRTIDFKEDQAVHQGEPVKK